MAGRRTPGIKIYLRRDFCTQILWSRECKVDVIIPRLRIRKSYWTHEIPRWIEELWALIFEKGKQLKGRKNGEIYWLPANVKEELLKIIEEKGELKTHSA